VSFQIPFSQHYSFLSQQKSTSLLARAEKHFLSLYTHQNKAILFYGSNFVV